MISGLLGLQGSDAYGRARKILDDRFGNSFKIYEAYKEKLKAWPICNTSSDLQEFSDFLVMTQETMKTVRYLREFDSFSTIRELAARRPNYYTNKWRENAKRVQAQKGDFNFDDFVEFVQDAASDATHPVFSHEALTATRRAIQKGTGKEERWSNKEGKPYTKGHRGTTLVASTNSEQNSGNPSLQN